MGGRRKRGKRVGSGCGGGELDGVSSGDQVFGEEGRGGAMEEGLSELGVEDETLAVG